MFQKMYFALFNAITDSLTQLEARNYGEAEHILREASSRRRPSFWKGRMPLDSLGFW